MTTGRDADMNRWNVSTSALLILAVCLFSACGEGKKGTTNDGAVTSAQASVISSPKTFRIATLTWVGYAPIYLAKEKGFFEGISVDPVLIEDTSSRRAALTSGDVVAST